MRWDESSEDVQLLRMELGKGNAIGHGFLDQLDARLDELEEREGALVVTGTGSFFSVGLSLPELIFHVPEP